MTRRDEDNEAESRRILKGVTDASAHGFLMKGVDSTRERLSAADVDQRDRIEVWGTRIGRTVGAGLLLVIAIWILVGLYHGA